MSEYNCTRIKVRDKEGNEFYVLYDKSRELLFSACMTVEFAIKVCGFEFIEESEDDNENCN